ncbi:MAG TPA: radical SAM family heme chaperone HemW, partial [Longimicrobiales bacterium]|nr:radical SAM family heme chaperone HemW [Longimicrobiales bacterium]
RTVIPEHLYLHVPFCLRRCPYCDFAVTVDRRPPVGAWTEAVRAELEALLAGHGWGAPLAPRTVYVGGGTPSLLGGEGMVALRRALEGLVDWSAVAEWTAEANPESFGADVAREWRDAGVDRVSIGAQTFHEPALRWMGRLHGADGPAAAVDAARAAGIEDVSVDLIFALPARLGRDWTDDLERALALEPTHLSLYGLTAEEGTPLGRWVGEGRERLPDEEGYEADYLEAARRLPAAGLAHYEVSNFARPGFESAHNRAYWRGAAYLGLGPSAHSYLPPTRWWNLRDWRAYASAVAEGRSALAGRERVEGDAARLEWVWLGLRAAEGLPADGLGEAALARVRAWERCGWVRPGDPDSGRVRLSAPGWLILDRLAVELDGSLDAPSGPGAHSARSRATEAEAATSSHATRRRS